MSDIIKKVSDAVVKAANGKAITDREWQEIMRRVKAQTERMVSITFMDGDEERKIDVPAGSKQYADNAGILLRHGIPFAVKPLWEVE